MTKEKSNNHMHLGIAIIISIVFLALKLDGTIDWAWIWVFSPIWLSFIAEFAINILTLIVIAIVNAITKANSISKYKRSKINPSLVWDPKTKTMYVPDNNEE